MAEEGKNKVASSLLDLQPTAVLDFYQIYPDRVNLPTLFIGFHGGAVFSKSVIWQGIQYLPVAIEAEGFDILGDGTLARPKIRVANQNSLVTNLLQNHKDLIHAKVVRKRVFVRYLDDVNFDGGNPFGIADPKAEISEDTWVMGRKTQESKIFVEFELNSPLDLENFNVNYRGIAGKFCYWQYRGEGCRYAGLPIEREDGKPFTNRNGETVVPEHRSFSPSPVNFYYDPGTEWNPTHEYIEGDVVVISSSSITIPAAGAETNDDAIPFRSVYVCVSGANTNQHPHDNPTYWQKDGCCKKLTACQKRFNDQDTVAYKQAQDLNTGWSGVQFSGAWKGDNAGTGSNTGFFHTLDTAVTGHLTGNFTLMGWFQAGKSMNRSAVFSTTNGDVTNEPRHNFLNLSLDSANQDGAGTDEGISEDGDRGWILEWATNDVDYRDTTIIREAPSLIRGDEITNGWNLIIITNDHDWGVDIDSDAEGSILTVYRSNGSEGFLNLNSQIDPNDPAGNWNWSADATNNFAGKTVRDAESNSEGPWWPTKFMLGAQRWSSSSTFNPSNATYRTMLGQLGPWATWNRVLSETERNFLMKKIVTPFDTAPNDTEICPRDYYHCTGNFTGITGNGLIAWWDASTGIIPSTSLTGMLDIHTGSHHLTGSGKFTGVANAYVEGRQTYLSNPTPPNPNFGGFPGTDGFSYGTDTSY